MRLFLIAPPLLPLANSAADTPLVGIANALAIGEDGWVIIPYGDTLHNGANATRANALAEVKGQPGVIQRFTAERAQGMANAFHSLRGKIKRAVIGMDVFKGHPDCAAFANLFRDQTPRGTIADMQARPEGLALKLVLTERGAADVEAGYNEISPYWLASPAGEEQGRKIYEPAILKSIGLVPRGNIAGLSLVNADPAFSEPTATITMKDQLIALLALLGITVPPETADDALAPFIDQAKAALKPKIEAEAELPAANAKIAELGALVTALRAESTTALANAQTEAATAAQTLRTQAATAVVSTAILAGRIPAAQRETEITALANAADFATAAAALAERKATLPTGSSLGNLGASGKDQNSRQQQLLGLVNAHMATAKCDYNEAFAAVSATEQGRALIGAMKKPGA